MWGVNDQDMGTEIVSAAHYHGAKFGIYDEDNARFIANAPSDVSYLLTKLDEARAEVARLTAERDRMRDTLDGLGAPELLDEIGPDHSVARLLDLAHTLTAERDAARQENAEWAARFQDYLATMDSVHTFLKNIVEFPNEPVNRPMTDTAADIYHRLHEIMARSVS
jgi:hypothetical protein